MMCLVAASPAIRLGLGNVRRWNQNGNHRFPYTTPSLTLHSPMGVDGYLVE